jgi:5-formyltetrahydrofolate cyclo-ligase
MSKPVCTMTDSDKKQFRLQIARRISELSPDSLLSGDLAIFERLKAIPEFIAARRVFTYISMGREPDTRTAIEFLLSIGKTVAVPKVLGNGNMKMVTIKGMNALKPGPLGILEPEEEGQSLQTQEVDLILVPGMAFDKDGYRLGRGGGYYDRLLCRTCAFTVGLCREAAFVEKVPREAHDIPVHKIVTEERIAGPFSEPRNQMM